MPQLKTFDAGMSLAKCTVERNWQVGMSIHVALHHRTTYTLRPARGARTAGRAPASRAAFPHRDPVLRAQGRAQAALHQLAAGSAGQSSRAPGLPREDRPLRGRGRPGRRHDGDQSVRLLPRARRRAVAVRLRSLARRRDRAVPQGRAAGPAARGVAGQGRSQQAAHRRFHRRPECAPAEGHRLHRAPGAGRAELRGDARARQGLVPRHRLAAGHHHAPSRLRRALRLGLPDPAHARREAARRTGRPDARLHRPPRLVRGLSAGRRLDRPRSDLGPADRRRPHPARLHARAVERGADRRRGRGERGRLRLRHEGDARARDAAHHQALQRRAVGQAAGRRRGDRARHRQARPAAHHGRRADLRVDRRHGRRRMEHAGAGAGEAAQGRRAVPQARRPLRQRAAAAFRPGQVVSRRAAAALGAQLPLAQGRRGDLARPASLCRWKTSRPAPRPRWRIASRWPSRSACSSIPAICSAPSRTPGTTCGASGACPATSRSTPPR